MTCGGHRVSHTCQSCGADDLLEGVTAEPYTCPWCHKARRAFAFMRRHGDKQAVPWQIVVLSRWLRHNAENPGGPLHQWYQPVPYHRPPPVQVLDERPGVYHLPMPPPYSGSGTYCGPAGLEAWHQGWLRYSHQQARIWSTLRTKITGEYGALWWQLAYAATPTYRHDREGGTAPLPIEYQAEQAALELMVAAGVLVRDPCPDEYSDDD